LAALKGLGGGYKCSWSFRSRGKICKNSTFFEFLNVCSLAYLLYVFFFSNKRGGLLSQSWPPSPLNKEAVLEGEEKVL
jgi:hypothetical protein